MDRMDSLQLFSNGEYMVIFVDMATYSARYDISHIIDLHSWDVTNSSNLLQGGVTIFI